MHPSPNRKVSFGVSSDRNGVCLWRRYQRPIRERDGVTWLHHQGGFPTPSAILGHEGDFGAPETEYAPDYVVPMHLHMHNPSLSTFPDPRKRLYLLRLSEIATD